MRATRIKRRRWATKPFGRGLMSIATAAALSGVLAAAAFASKPEVPLVSVPEVTGTTAVSFGTLNPGAAEMREVGTYQFIYRAATDDNCEGAGEAVVPASPAMSNGSPHEEVAEFIEGLTPGTEYAVCLAVTEAGKTEPAVSAAVTFRTRQPPEQPLTEQPSNVTSGAAQLNATLNPNAPGEPNGTYAFDVNRDSEECEGPQKMQVPGSPVPASGEENEAVTAVATGLLPRTKYAYCAVAFNEVGESTVGDAVTFETPARGPTITNLAVEEVRSTEATVEAGVDPGGLSTEVTVDVDGVPQASKALPASKVPVGVQQHIIGLAPSTKYVAQVVAVNEAGREEADVMFESAGTRTRTTSESSCVNESFVGFRKQLPDCRAVELVSAAGERGEVYDPGGSDGHEEDITTARPFRAAASGDKVAYLGDPGPTGGDGSTAKGRGNEFIATRSVNGWGPVNVTPPVGEGENASDEREYTSLSADLSTGTVASEQPLTGAAPAPQGPAQCNVLYSVDETTAAPEYAALFTSTLTPAFCGELAGPSGRDEVLSFDGETSDHTVQVFDSAAELAPPAIEAFGFGSNVYVSRQPGAELALVNVLPDGAVEPRAVAGGPAQLPRNGPDLSDVISPDGRRVLWSGVVPGESIKEEKAAFAGALYVREDPFAPSAQTVELDGAEEGAPGQSGGGEFWGASSDVNKVFFTDCHRLTTDSTAVEGETCTHVAASSTLDLVKSGTDLYEYDFQAGAGGRKLTDLTVDDDPADVAGADVQGVLGVSDDGNYVYFIAGGALGAAPNGRGETPQAETCEPAPEATPEAAEELAGHVPLGLGCNLFELHFNGSTWDAPRFIAKLSAQDNLAFAEKLNAPFSTNGETAGDWNPRLGSRTAEVTPDGRALVFSSIQDITGYNTAHIGTLNGRQGGNEIFLYSADTNAVSCVSCNPRNAPPIPAIQSGAGFATYVPVSSSDTFMHRWVNASGTEVFFDSSQPLAEEDGNGRQDVYEWAAQGSTSCPVSTSVYGGCVFLLTAGETEDYSFLIDTDESGQNVFVTHRGPLYTVGPTDTKNHLFDLRVNGGGAPAVGSGCTSVAGCPAAPTPEPAASPPASSVIGSENGYEPQHSVVKKTTAQLRAEKLAKALKVCRSTHRKSRKKRRACEHAARQHYQGKKPKPPEKAKK
jgi:hypothetical protein